MCWIHVGSWSITHWLSASGRWEQNVSKHKLLYYNWGSNEPLWLRQHFYTAPSYWPIHPVHKISCTAVLSHLFYSSNTEDNSYVKHQFKQCFVLALLPKNASLTSSFSSCSCFRVTPSLEPRSLCEIAWSRVWNISVYLKALFFVWLVST